MSHSGLCPQMPTFQGLGRKSPMTDSATLACGGHSPESASHTFTDPSCDDEARRLPSGLKHTLTTMFVCPLRVRACWPVTASHTFTVMSFDAEARRLPSGLKHTPYTGVMYPLRVTTS